MELFDLFDKGGPVMYLLFLSSVLIIAVGIERLNFYNYAENNGVQFLELLKDKLKSQDINAIANFCHNEKNCMAAVAFAGIVAALNREKVDAALDIAYSDAAMKLRSKLNYLSMFVTLSPLLGLLGTIFGMIESFNIFNLQSGQPLAITGGIGEALIATATGLCVAILALLLHTYFAQRLDVILSKMEKAENLILAHFYSKEADS